MNIEIEIRSMKFYLNDDGKRSYKKLCFADVYLPALNLNIREVLLTFEPGKGYLAMAPLARGYTGLPALQWKHTGEFAKAVAQAMLTAYQAMGGTLPDAANDDSGVRRTLGGNA